MDDNHASRVHEKPPAVIKEIYKAYQKLDKPSLSKRRDLIDLTSTNTGSDCLVPRNVYRLPSDLRRTFLDFVGSSHETKPRTLPPETPQVFEIPTVSGKPSKSLRIPTSSEKGLYIYPSLIPPELQISLLDKLLQRDLCNSEHKTNVHLHHDIPYPTGNGDGRPKSYFDPSSRNLMFEPNDPSMHKPFTTQQFLDKKLRWMTLGGQYDWTNKVYPDGPPPRFPLDVKRLIEDIFPMKAEAAIVNLYSPGDTLSLHRDVSEECDQPLVSISIGCDGIFVIGLDGTNSNGEPKIATIRLRSGDAVLMSSESRFAWHGVPKVLDGTCPDWLKDWPCRMTKEESDCEDHFGHWRGWMKGKRINLNVRQMFA